MFAISAPRIFDGEVWRTGCAVLADAGRVLDLVALAELPDVAHHACPTGMLVPGFVDLQVNGAGGVLLNDDRSLDGLTRLCAANFRFGTTALLPTLITDTSQVTAQALAMGQGARDVPGFAGLHLEGPHLAPARKGAHDAGLIRPMQDSDADALIAARAGLDTLLVTLAPESAGCDQIARLVAAGVVVSLGHSDASADQAAAAFQAGASMVTHLFNAMSQLGSREPGLVGAALAHGVWAGLIADGIHVDPLSLGIALRAKRGPGQLFLVTDAMSPMGTDMAGFALNGRAITRAGGALRLADGTLAGADLTMIDAVRMVHRTLGLELGQALRMAGLYPAQAIGRDDRLGRLRRGSDASVAHLGDDLTVAAVWERGARVF